MQQEPGQVRLRVFLETILLPRGFGCPKWRIFQSDLMTHITIEKSKILQKSKPAD
jgi:hypothetical protein